MGYRRSVSNSFAMVSLKAEDDACNDTETQDELDALLAGIFLRFDKACKIVPNELPSCVYTSRPTMEAPEISRKGSDSGTEILFGTTKQNV